LEDAEDGTAAGAEFRCRRFSAAVAAMPAHPTALIARIREQLGISISKFEGVEEPLARIVRHPHQLRMRRDG